MPYWLIKNVRGMGTPSARVFVWVAVAVVMLVAFTVLLLLFGHGRGVL
jgi:hypothetical protein